MWKQFSSNSGSVFMICLHSSLLFYIKTCRVRVWRWCWSVSNMKLWTSAFVFLHRQEWDFIVEHFSVTGARNRRSVLSYHGIKNTFDSNVFFPADKTDQCLVPTVFFIYWPWKQSVNIPVWGPRSVQPATAAMWQWRHLRSGLFPTEQLTWADARGQHLPLSRPRGKEATQLHQGGREGVTTGWWGTAMTHHIT